MSLWDQPLADMCSPTSEAGQQVCGAQESVCPRGSCVAQRRFCDGTDDCGDGSDEGVEQCSEHPWPWGGVLGWAEGLPWWGKAVLWPGRSPPKFTPRQEGKMTLRVYRGVAPAQPIAGTWDLSKRGLGPQVSGSLLSLLLTDNFTRCSFDHSLCGWEAVAGPAEWGRNTSLNLGTSYGIPTRDHSNNSRAGTWQGTSAPAEPRCRWTCPGVTHAWALLKAVPGHRCPAPTHLPGSTQPQHLLQVFSSMWAVPPLHRLLAQLSSAAPLSKPPTPVL